ncbi:cobalt import ATP-binding protein CbiO 1 [Clostridium botulinum C str. Eklund]|nr:cobalt import ATP-binding protein CbiO 1 [Clostridium botulinum C str. Eklund]NEZ48936.1 ATP-binding cassette domain-containing protein [Clostridium botulinum]
MQIDFKNISYQYSGKNKILNDISMTISEGVYGLLGENGAGKTTLIKLLATLNPIQKGSIIIDGLSVEKDYLNIRKRLGYLPQNIEFLKV